MIKKDFVITPAGRVLLLLVMVFMGFTTTVLAQSRVVAGTVKDTGGNPMIGVAVTVPGTTAGTSSNVDGTFSLTVPSNSENIRFSYIGYQDLEIPIGSQTNIEAVMFEKTEEIETIEVSVGYGVQKKRDLTAPVASVSSKTLEMMPVASASEAITGRMAGVHVTSTEGGPDAEIKIRVRGGGSITQDNSPLYIVDGFEVSSINDISSSDIQSIDVLKDASSAAIYGARGANGVVIVTTKSGQEGKTKITFNAYAGVKTLSNQLDMMDPYEYVMWQYELSNYRSSEVDYDKTFMKYYGAYDDLELYKGKSGTNWQQEVFGRTAVTQNYNIGVSGGTKAATYNIGLSHLNDQSIMIGAGQVRSNINLTLKGELFKNFSYDLRSRWGNNNILGAGTSTEGSSSISRLKHALKYMPVKGIADYIMGDDDLLEEMETQSEFNNPVDITNDEYRKTVRNSQAYNLALIWKPIKGLTLRSEGGISTQDEGTNRFYGVTTGTAKSFEGNPVVKKEEKDVFQWSVSNTATWSRDFNKAHSLTILLGQEASSRRTDVLSLEARNFSKTITREQALANTNLANSQPIQTKIGTLENMLSFFGRVNYNYKDRYLFTATFRGDGSSKFAPGNRWGYFPSAAVAWRINEESWMESTRGWLSNLKLRFSAGGAGNNRIDNDLWKQMFETNTSSKPITINGQPQTIIRPTNTLANENLKWETTVTRDIGLDFGFWNNRVTGTVDVYWNNTKDLLILATIPSSTGFKYRQENTGRTSNRGVEITLDGAIIQTRDFRLGANFNVAFNKNRIEDLGGIQSRTEATYWYNSTNPEDDYLVEVGKPMGQIYGYVTDGYYTIDDFNYTYNESTGKATWSLKDGIPSSTSVTGGQDLPGMLKFKDLDGSGTITSADRKVIGNALPVAAGGFNLNMQWKNFDAAAYFNYSIGNKIYNANKIELTSYPLTRKYGNLLTTMENRFTYIDRATGESLLNDIDRLRAANADASMWSPILTRVPVHSWAIEDGSFLRLSNVTIGYSLPSKIASKIFMQSMRVYITGYNLWILTKYSGFDPEVDAKYKSPLTPGVDYSAFPRAISVVAGINVTF